MSINRTQNHLFNSYKTLIDKDSQKLTTMVKLGMLEIEKWKNVIEQLVVYIAMFKK